MRWIQRTPDQAVVDALQRHGGFSPLVARLLANRGVATPEQAQRYLAPSAADLIDPLLLPDIGPAVERFRRAVDRGERLMLFGDYDVDGVSAVSIYRELCGQLGLDAVVRLPRRLSEGYGLSRDAVREAKAAQAALIVTADCGTTALAEIAFARDEGIDVIVTDHHQVPGELPAAVATINPWRADSRYPFRGLCSAGLAWKVASAVAGQPWAPAAMGSWLARSLDLVALGTIADVMSLQMENRYFVVSGLSLLNHGARAGVRALKRVAGIEGKPVGVGTINFALAPRLNAAGRLGDAASGVELLTTADDAQAARLAEHHQRENEARRAIEDIVLREALAQTASVNVRDATAVIAAGEGWHPGVIGIVAARLVERYYRPAVVIAIDPATGLGRGSGRTIPGIDLYAALEACAPRLVQFGGHRMAAGLTIRAEEVEPFRAAFAEAVARQVQPATFEPLLTVDAEISLDDCTWALMETLGRLAPFGPANPEPLFMIKGVVPANAKSVGNGHLRFTLRASRSAAPNGDRPSGLAMPAVAFDQGHRDKELAGEGSFDVVCALREERWQGERRLQLHIKDFAVAPSMPQAATAAGSIAPLAVQCPPRTGAPP
ncbi:MAG: single-stranded-DNA-specific exonuclease RecJ [Nitrospirota bacterium]